MSEELTQDRGAWITSPLPDGSGGRRRSPHMADADHGVAGDPASICDRAHNWGRSHYHWPDPAEPRETTLAACPPYPTKARMKVKNEHRIIGIELLRFVSAFAVLIWHFQHFGYGEGEIDIIRSEQPFYSLLRPFYEHGAIGVQVFWAISGFIIFFKYTEVLCAGKINAGSFAVARLSRLYPLHFITLILVLPLQMLYLIQHGEYFVYLHNDGLHFVLNLLFASHWGFEEGDSFNGPIWSVSIEILVYAAFFVLVSCFGIIGAYAGAAALLFLFSIIGLGVVSICLLYFFTGGALALLRFHSNRIGLPVSLCRHGFHLAGASLLIAAPAAVWVLMRSPQPTYLALLASLILVLLAIYLLVVLDC
ncbi:acyltransferase, partial [Paracoccus liaowanqingii]